MPATIAHASDPYVRGRLLGALRERHKKSNTTFSERGAEILAHGGGDSLCTAKLREFCTGFLAAEECRRA